MALQLCIRPARSNRPRLSGRTSRCSQPCGWYSSHPSPAVPVNCARADRGRCSGCSGAVGSRRRAGGGSLHAHVPAWRQAGGVRCADEGNRKSAGARVVAGFPLSGREDEVMLSAGHRLSLMLMRSRRESAGVRLQLIGRVPDLNSLGHFAIKSDSGNWGCKWRRFSSGIGPACCSGLAPQGRTTRKFAGTGAADSSDFSRAAHAGRAACTGAAHSQPDASERRAN